jgi:glycosyltransferase involved in cell wall biosynthesis
MKKLVFFAYDLNIGGIERSLLNLLKVLDYSNYEVTLYLEKKEGLLLKELPNEVKIVEYKISDNKNVVFRKIYNRLKLIITLINNYHKFDFSCCYATHIIPGSTLSRYFSNNNCFWIHSNYYELYNKDINKIKTFFNKRNLNKFKHVAFVSNESRNDLLNVYPFLNKNSIVCNNLIDNIAIEKMSNEIILDKKPNKTLFINVSRHEEHSKKITRIIEASKELSEERYDFEVWLIGDGQDTGYYTEMIAKYNLSNRVKILGSKKNPYPYFKLADAFILTSEYEGFGIVHLEAAILGLTMITTIDASSESIETKKIALLVDKNINSIKSAMIRIINGEQISRKKINANQFNESIKNKVTKFFNNKW